jgi:uncharacterized OB-fold protein
MSETSSHEPSARYLLRDMDTDAAEFYRRLATDRHVATTRCEPCTITSFPPRSRCAECGAETEWITLPDTGHLHAFTTQESSIRFRAPAVLALAELGDVVVPGIAGGSFGELEIGQAISIELRDEAETGLTLVWFAPRTL